MIKGLLFIMASAACCRAAGGAAEARSPEWLLDDALTQQQDALAISCVSTPAEYAEALDDYRRGEYRRAAAKLEKLRSLNLPDGRTDFLYFLLAESYRRLGDRESALERYRHIVERFPSSDKTVPSLFRLLQYAYEDRNTMAADSIFDVFRAHHRSHVLYNSVLYTLGLLYYRTERYGEAIELLVKIPPNTARHFQAQFLAALCFVRVEKTDKALFHLGYVRQNALDKALIEEAGVVIADIYYSQGNLQTALQYYSAVTKNAPRYFDALVKSARIRLELKDYASAENIARRFMEKNRQSPFYFEMASILEQVYTQTGQKERAAGIHAAAYKQIVDAKLGFEIDRELGMVEDIAARWRRIRLDALVAGNEALVREADTHLARVLRLDKEHRRLLLRIGFLSRGEEDSEIGGLAERRYVNALRRRVQALEDSVRLQDAALERFRARKTPADSVSDSAVQAAGGALDSARERLATLREEYNRLRHVAWTEKERSGIFSDEMQAKFIDWSFARYQEKKDELERMNRRLAEKTHPGAADSLSKQGREIAALFGSIDRERLEQEIREERGRLAGHIETYLEFSPSTAYFPQILMRLAELTYDEAVEDFGARLKEYERVMALDGGKRIAFPEYDLKGSIAVYDRIISEYPKDWLADDAHFYKAAALQKMGRFAEANDVLLALVKAYPESEYFVEANMNIGRYYFENPKAEDGKGYDRAQEAYRRVLQFRDHPQFIEALYRLGWCYYMQDKYPDAIAVFKYLIEEVEMDFDPRTIDEKQVANPLLREEAIDYIAISFNEEGDIDEAVRFLDLVGSPDYAAMVLKRIGELREEDMDYANAVKVYRRLLDEYPAAMIAPDAAISLIKVYEITNNATLAMKEREDFFTRYARGGPWQQQVGNRYTALIKDVDSMAVSMGLFIADAQYRQAESTADKNLYANAVASYRRLMAAYPSDGRAAEGQWNLAVILETRLNMPDSAYGEYITFSRLEGADRVRREQAALNAIAIAQTLLLSDSAVEAGKLSPAAVRVIDASQNYLQLFGDGAMRGDVALTMGSVYFNRKMYASAAKAFSIITDAGPAAGRYFEARMLTAKCLFGEEKWMAAAEAFEEVWKGSADGRQRDEAYTLMLQARYLFAQQFFDGQAYEKAARAFIDIEKKYPGSSYGDVVLFSAAEAYEKIEQWRSACDTYYALFKTYPMSKFAPDALFNAATAYEKANDFEKAAETYELLSAAYPTSAKAKDGLFNLGFCYEKMGKPEKMAEANERFTRLYPEEKDVEAMLLRSAEFYFKAAMHEKVIGVCRNFAARYARNPRSVEAYYMIGKSCLALGDTSGAAAAFAKAEEHNGYLRNEKLSANDYFAAEAAYQTALIQRARFDAQSLASAPPQSVKAVLKAKTETLAEAVKAFQRVVHYRSERMFEAGYSIGKMYEDLAADMAAQKSAEKDPITMAVARKDVCIATSAILQKAFEPYSAIIDIALKLDSLEGKQAQWVDSARTHLAGAVLEAGKYLAQSVEVMETAPLPREIAGQLLYRFQYGKQLLETLEPMKAGIRDYYLAAYKRLLPYTNEKACAECLEEASRYNCLIAQGYDRLAEQILLSTDQIPADLPAEEREELVFQFEDMVYELQDKALFAYEDALALAKRENITGNAWYRIILDRLAKLNPEKYGAGLYIASSFGTGGDWLARCDSVQQWISLDGLASGWGRALSRGSAAAQGFAGTAPDVIWAECGASGHAYFCKPFALEGQPREAKLYFTIPMPYRLYVNERLISADSTGGRGAPDIDSVADMAEIVKGGDNIISICAGPLDGAAGGGIAIAFSALIDTSQRFESKLNLMALRPAAEQAREKPQAQETAQAERTRQQTTAPATESLKGKVMPDYIAKYRNRGEFLQAITDYQTQEQQLQSQIRRERLEVQKLELKRDETDKKIRAVKAEIEQIKKAMHDMERGR